jgi:formylglycine-generating enzyme required for sulfatase activity
MAYKPAFHFSSRPEEYAAHPVPSLNDWENLWAVWDTVTRQMIPEDELLSKPIKLRNACIFYLGHIPTFLDIHLSRATGEFSKELKYYQKIFERGIDPDVDNPELCHDHSEIPDTWPPAEDIIAFQGRVRERTRSLVALDPSDQTFAVRKALWIGFEHEAMHLETLLYMLVQSEKTLPPQGVVKPDFEALAQEAESKTVPNEWFEIPGREIAIGIDDPDSDIKTERYFGWDNEKPKRSAEVKSFSAKARPITNREFLKYLQATGSNDIPASWTKSEAQRNGHANGQQNGNVSSNGVHSGFLDGKAVRTVFGNVPLKYTLDWPVLASYNELASCAAWMGGRIPTMEEVRSIYQHVEELKRKDFDSSIAKKIPAVNGHLVNNGVEETPPSKSELHRFSNGSGPLPSDLFVDLQNANVGFAHWHPVAVTMSGSLVGQSETGGAWEWTSSVLEKHAGFEPMELYPGYTGESRNRSFLPVG